MNPEQHANLCQAVAGFKQQFLECLDRGYESIEDDLVAWRQSVQTRIQQKFAHVEELLAGPYNRELTWDWVPDDREFDDIATFVSERRVRLREDPSLEMSGREYFEKYAKGGLGLLRVLETAGYYAPPANKFFQPFCKQLLEGSKTLLRREEVAQVFVPPDQVDLAFSKAQEMIAADQRLQRYCPLGIPILRVDKEFYLNIVNTLIGLPYKVVLPLSEAEQRSAAQIRQLVIDADKGLGPVGKLRAEVRVLGRFVEGVEDSELESTAFLELMEGNQKRVREQHGLDLDRVVLVSSLPCAPLVQHHMLELHQVDHAVAVLVHARQDPPPQVVLVLFRQVHEVLQVAQVDSAVFVLVERLERLLYQSFVQHVRPIDRRSDELCIVNEPVVVAVADFHDVADVHWLMVAKH